MINNLINNYPVLEVCRKDISDAFELIKSVYEHDGIILACGNGGSAADAEHMVGELMKTFNLERPLPEDIQRNLIQKFGDQGTWLAKNLQSSLKAISLVGRLAKVTMPLVSAVRVADVSENPRSEPTNRAVPHADISYLNNKHYIPRKR